jgi:hypothetical protein
MRNSRHILLAVVALLIAFTGIGAFRTQRTQDQTSEARSEEIVANQATGRIYVLVIKDAIVVGALGIPSEPGSLPPEIVQMDSKRMAVLLGAVDWRATDSGKQIASLARELPSLRPQSAAGQAPHLQQEDAGGVAADLEIVGIGVFERLQAIATQLHAPIHLPDAQPVLQIVLADYVEDYGPEVWTLDYKLHQEELRANFLQTQINRPHYVQLWPPDKGQPHSLIEFSYPGVDPKSFSESLLNDSRLKSIGGAVPKLADVQQAILAGDTRKILPADAITFMRAALSGLADNGSNYAIAAIGEHTGFTWIVQPKGSVEEQKDRPASAPTLGRP